VICIPSHGPFQGWLVIVDFHILTLSIFSSNRNWFISLRGNADHGSCQALIATFFGDSPGGAELVEGQGFMLMPDVGMTSLV